MKIGGSTVRALVLACSFSALVACSGEVSTTSQQPASRAPGQSIETEKPAESTTGISPEKACEMVTISLKAAAEKTASRDIEDGIRALSRFALQANEYALLVEDQDGELADAIRDLANKSDALFDSLDRREGGKKGQRKIDAWYAAGTRVNALCP